MDGGVHGRGWCKGFIYVWDKRFLILNSGWDCSGYSAAYDCSSGADFWQDGASSWWGILDQMRAEKFSLVKQGQVKSRSHWCIANGIRLAVKDKVLLCKYDIVQYFGASALVWAVEMFFIHISSACVHSVYRWFCACLQGLDIKNGKLGHERLKTGLEHITSVIWWDKFWSLWCHSNSFSIQEEVVRDYIWR